MFLRSKRRGGSVRNRRSLLVSRRGVGLLGPSAEGASSLGDLLHPHGRVRHHPHHPAAAAGLALPTAGLLRGD